MSLYEHYEVYRKYKTEIDWWEENLAPDKRHFWMKDCIDPKKRGAWFPINLFDFIKELNLNTIPNVLDVGSGPLSILAGGIDQKIIEVIAIDPLAEIYKNLLSKYNISYPVIPVEGIGEKIDEMFEEDFFHVVYSRNALDHSDSPSLCINNMVSRLRKGGILYIEGFVNEGTANGWEGLHKWNFQIEGSNITCYNKSGDKVDLTKDLPLRCFYNSEPNEGRWFIISFKKT